MYIAQMYSYEFLWYKGENSSFAHGISIWDGYLNVRSRNYGVWSVCATVCNI